MTDATWDSIGWPSPGTRVYTPKDQRPLVTPPTRMSTRKCALDRHARYRARKRLKKLLGAT